MPGGATGRPNDRDGKSRRSLREATFWPGWCFNGSVHAAAQEGWENKAALLTNHSVLRTPIAPPNIASPLIGHAEASISAPVPPPVETLFTQLARRRLRGRTTEETR